MKTAGEFLTKHISIQKGNILHNEEIWYDVESAMKEYAKQLLSDYTDRIVENVEIDWGLVHAKGVDKQSITNQLPEFLKTIL